MRPKKKCGNTGSSMGLWLAQSIAEAHQGVISVYSEGEGKGASFHIDIPISKLDVAPESPSYGRGGRRFSSSGSSVSQNHSSASLSGMVLLGGDEAKEMQRPKSPVKHGSFFPPTHIDTGSSKGKRQDSSSSKQRNSEGNSSKSFKHHEPHVPSTPPSLRDPIRSMLIVDDSNINRKMTVRYFRGKVSHIEEAVDGIDAHEKVKARLLATGHGYDVIMLDSCMPRMCGPELVRILREEQKYKGLVIGATGNSLPQDIDDFLGAGLDHLMVKPVNMASFYEYAAGKLS